MQKVITVKIKDNGTDKSFFVRPFNAMEGIEFMDTLVNQLATMNSNGISIKNLMSGLLPLATLAGSEIQMSLDTVDTYFENPYAPIELAYKTLKHQMGFMKESEVFQPLTKPLEALLNIPTSD